jgi:hypothetical protein
VVSYEKIREVGVLGFNISKEGITLAYFEVGNFPSMCQDDKNLSCIINEAGVLRFSYLHKTKHVLLDPGSRLLVLLVTIIHGKECCRSDYNTQQRNESESQIPENRKTHGRYFPP